MSVDEDAWPEVQAEGGSTQPKAGYRFNTVAVRIQVVDGYFTATNTFEPSRFKAVGSSGIEFSATACGRVPNELNSTTMFQGAVIEGNLCVEVPKDETDLLIYYENGYDSPKLWLQARQSDSIEAIRDVSAKVVTDSSVDIGTQRTNPISAGRTALTDDGLGITVMSVDADAWPEVKAENYYNDPPKAGYRFLMAKVRIQVVDGYFTNPINVSAYGFGVVGSSAVLAGTCGSYPLLPDELAATMFHGGVTQGNLCVEVPEDETDLLIYYKGDSATVWSQASQPDSIEVLREVSAEVIIDPLVNIGTQRTNPICR